MFVPSLALAAGANVIKDTLACEGIGHFGVMDNLRADGDEEAVKKLKAGYLRRGSCRIIKAGTPVFFYHFMEYTDGDYGSFTTIRRKGDTRSWVLEKCALDARDPDVARFPGYTVPEKPCNQ